MARARTRPASSWQVDFEVTVAELVGRGELRAVDLHRLGAQVRLADYQNLEHLEGDLSDLDEKPARAAAQVVP